ncbi:MAG TPA: glutamate racemase [Candidatus Krumholzibacteria bacterium]|nr:glutamate racemase [Candidatus Krumholzibacteria bacterium]
MSDKPIGVFDSGIGGMTVLRELIEHLPHESFVYFGDTARLPYGNKSAETVQRFSRENVRLLLDRGVKMVVVACNTATAEALPGLQREFSLPIVGVIDPGVRAAVAATRNGHIGVIGTAGTIRSGAYQNGIREKRPDAHVIPLACPLFVPLVEEGWIDTPVTRLVVENYLSPFVGHTIDTLVLGCTHYPLLKPVIQATLGNDVVLVDSAIETAREVAVVLDEQGLAGKNGGSRFHIILSDTSPAFEDVAARFLGRRVPDVELVSVL